MGLSDIINERDNVILVEWADKIKDILPKNTIWINFEEVDENTRRITIKR